MLSDHRFANNFTRAERELIEAHVPWTRLVRDSYTTDAEGRRVNLLTYATEKRNELVLKPSNATRGEGVKIGCLTEPSEWERGLHNALRGATCVLQEYISAPTLSAPNPSDGTIESMVFGLDVFVFCGHFAGFHARASIDPIINVGKRGILMPVAVASSSSPDSAPTDCGRGARVGEVANT